MNDQPERPQDREPEGREPEEREQEEREPEWKRKQRLAEIFGDVLPSVTSDERDDAPPKKDESVTDQWLKSQVPPHHG